MIASLDMRCWLAALSMIGTAGFLCVAHADLPDDASPMQPAAHAAIATPSAGLGPAVESSTETTINRSADGMFYIHGASAGARIRFIVDTGASVTVLTAHDAAAFGDHLVPTSGSGQLMTVGGARRVQEAELKDLVVAGRRLPPLRVAIMDSEMDVSLLDQNALSKLGPILFANDQMTLR